MMYLIIVSRLSILHYLLKKSNPESKMEGKKDVPPAAPDSIDDLIGGLDAMAEDKPAATTENLPPPASLQDPFEEFISKFSLLYGAAYVLMLFAGG